MLRLLACLLLAALFGGCAVSDEDKAFYYSGWVNPNKKQIYSEHDSAGRNPPGAGYRPDPLDQ